MERPSHDNKEFKNQKSQTEIILQHHQQQQHQKRRTIKTIDYTEQLT
jgi:hypothetical protein